MDTILFDLDGTLLPMDQDAFMKIYFYELSKKCATHGFDASIIPKAVWAGTKQMVNNDGTATNEDCFWHTFSEIMGHDILDMKSELELFYENEFHAAKAATKENPLAAETVRRLKKEGYTLVLASNPLFPMCAYATRLSWIGLTLDDFDLVTGYETFHYCKPNPQYYAEILTQIGKESSQCLMVGNDAHEDMSASCVGIDVYLVTDNLIPVEKPSSTPCGSGSFSDFCQWLAKRTA